MKTNRWFSFLLITFVVIAGSVVSASAAPPPPKPKPLSCSLVGTWSGWADHDWENGPNLAWTSVQTEGTNPTNGGIVMSWVPGPYGDMFSGSGARLTAGHGLWQGSGTQFNYTWYAYLIGDDPTNPDTYGKAVGSIRSYGVVTFTTDCNNATISYTVDMFSGFLAPDKMSRDSASYLDSLAGHGGETRAPLVPPPL